MVAVVPPWVAPSTDDVKGCHRLAHERAPRHLAARPIAAAIDWVTGVYTAPVSARALKPTAEAARSEMMLASAVLTGQGGLPRDLWEMLDVPPADAVTDDREWLEQASATLGWLLGVHGHPLRHH